MPVHSARTNHELDFPRFDLCLQFCPNCKFEKFVQFLQFCTFFYICTFFFLQFYIFFAILQFFFAISQFFFRVPPFFIVFIEGPGVGEFTCPVQAPFCRGPQGGGGAPHAAAQRGGGGGAVGPVAAGGCPLVAGRPGREPAGGRPGAPRPPPSAVTALARQCASEAEASRGVWPRVGPTTS